MVFDVERVLFRYSSDDLFCPLDFTQRDVDPDVLQHVRNLAEERLNSLQACGQRVVDVIFNRTEITHVVNVNGVAQLADSLDSPLALFEASWIPRQVEIDERGEPLKIESLGCCVGSEQQTEFAPTHPEFLPSRICQQICQ